jgi:hypothetical protein
MSYKPFEIAVLNEQKPDEIQEVHSDDGRILITVGPIQVTLKQSDDGLGVIVDIAEKDWLSDPPITHALWYEDFEDENLEEDDHTT